MTSVLPSHETAPTPHVSPSEWGLFGLLLLGITWLYLSCIDASALGFFHDDGIYTASAKGLAAGHGYRLEHLVGRPYNHHYPPLLALMLAPIWFLYPSFPDNILLLSLIPCLSTMLALLILFSEARKTWGLSWIPSMLLILWVAGNKALLFCATTIMSEGPYLLFSLLAFRTFAQYQETESRKHFILLLFTTLLSFYTRLIGVLLIPAFGITLFIQGKRRQAVKFSLFSGLLTVGIWQIWLHTTATPLTPENFAILNPYADYGQFFSGTIGIQQYGQHLLENGLTLVQTLGETFSPNLLYGLPKTWPAVTSHLWIIVPGILLLTLIKPFFTLIRQAELPNTLALASAFYVTFYLLAIVFWNYEQHTYRFLSIITPWLGLLTLHALPKRKQTLQAVLLLVLTFFLQWQLLPAQYNSVYLPRKSHETLTRELPQYRGLWQEYEEAFTYIRNNTPKEAPIAALNNTSVYLYTGHPTLFLFYSALPLRYEAAQSKAEIRHQFQTLMDTLDREHFQYLLLEPQLIGTRESLPANVVALQLLQLFPNRFTPVYQTHQQRITLYQILPKRRS